jgi:hypothetical protein
MKTFQEAISSTMMAKIPMDSEDSERDEAIRKLEESQERFNQTMEEIQTSEECHIFAMFLVEHLPDHIPLLDKFKIAISHGVMVGIEMEKPC